MVSPSITGVGGVADFNPSDDGEEETKMEIFVTGSGSSSWLQERVKKTSAATATKNKTAHQNPFSEDDFFFSIFTNFLVNINF